MIVLCGCGGKDKPGPAGSAKTASPIPADAATKANALNAVTELESCYVDEQSYASCAAPTVESIGPDNVKIPAASAGAYRIVAHSRSGTDFVVTKTASGAVKRSCTKARTGGCRAHGTW